MTQVYGILDSKLQWGIEANSPEEAHAKAQSLAASYVSRELNTSARAPIPSSVKKEINRIMRGKFEVVVLPGVLTGWSWLPKTWRNK